MTCTLWVVPFGSFLISSLLEVITWGVVYQILCSNRFRVHFALINRRVISLKLQKIAELCFSLQCLYDRSGKNNFTDSEIQTSLYVDASKSPSNSFIQLLADKNGAVNAGETVSFSVKATESLAYITMQVCFTFDRSLAVDNGVAKSITLTSVV